SGDALARVRVIGPLRQVVGVVVIANAAPARPLIRQILGGDFLAAALRHLQLPRHYTPLRRVPTRCEKRSLPTFAPSEGDALRAATGRPCLDLRYQLLDAFHPAAPEEQMLRSESGVLLHFRNDDRVLRRPHLDLAERDGVPHVI